MVSMNWAKSVKAEMLIPSKVMGVKTHGLRNAYQVKLEREYNPGTSVRHPYGMKMYAELTRSKALELADKKPLG